MNQPTDEPSEGINTSPTIFRPCILHTHNQHAADYIRIIVKSGMSLPMGEDRSAPLVTEVLPLLLLYAIPIPSLILLLVILDITIYSLFSAFVLTQALQKIRLVNHNHSLAELLHADIMQQLELALLGSPVARLLDVLLMGIQQQIMSSCSTAVPLHPSTTLSTSSSLPSVPIMGITNTESPAEAKASTIKVLPPTMSTDVEAVSPKCYWIIPVPIPTPASKSSCLPSKLPVVLLSLQSWHMPFPEQINHPGGCKDYQCQLCDFQHTNKDCMLTHTWQHLEILIGFPMCGKGFQNVASLHKAGRKIHSIHIVEIENE